MKKKHDIGNLLMAFSKTSQWLYRPWIMVIYIVHWGTVIQGQLDIAELRSSLLLPPSPTGFHSIEEGIPTKNRQVHLSTSMADDRKDNRYVEHEAPHSFPLINENTKGIEEEHIAYSATSHSDHYTFTQLPYETNIVKEFFKSSNSLNLDMTEIKNADFSEALKSLESVFSLQNSSLLYNSISSRSAVLFTQSSVLHSISMPLVKTTLSSQWTSLVDNNFGASSPFLTTPYKYMGTETGNPVLWSSFPDNINSNSKSQVTSQVSTASAITAFPITTFVGHNRSLNFSKPISTSEIFKTLIPKNTSEINPPFSKATTSPIPANGKRFMLTLKAQNCPQGLSKMFENQFLTKRSSSSSTDSSVKVRSFFLEECNSEFTVNITVRDPSLLDEIVSTNVRGKMKNFSIDVFNNTFYIASVETLDHEFKGSVTSNSSSITKVSKHEFSAYVTVGVSFGLVLIICISVCCAKLCLKRSIKTLGVSRSSQIQLRFEDYTLTPIPRPSSLRVDYYRGSLTGDLYSTTSAGSIASTPTVELGVVQPFDTSIVPLEDSIAVPDETSKRPSVEPATNSNATCLKGSSATNSSQVQSGNSNAECKERLHLKLNKISENNSEDKNCGLTNPTFQKY